MLFIRDGWFPALAENTVKYFIFFFATKTDFLFVKLLLNKTVPRPVCPLLFIRKRRMNLSTLEESDKERGSFPVNKYGGDIDRKKNPFPLFSGFLEIR